MNLQIMCVPFGIHTEVRELVMGCQGWFHAKGDRTQCYKGLRRE